jgi:hypothetical protein
LEGVWHRRRRAASRECPHPAGDVSPRATGCGGRGGCAEGSGRSVVDGSTEYIIGRAMAEFQQVGDFFLRRKLPYCKHSVGLSAKSTVPLRRRLRQEVGGATSFPACRRPAKIPSLGILLTLSVPKSWRSAAAHVPLDVCWAPVYARSCVRSWKCRRASKPETRTGKLPSFRMLDGSLSGILYVGRRRTQLQECVSGNCRSAPDRGETPPSPGNRMSGYPFPRSLPEGRSRPEGGLQETLNGDRGLPGRVL